MGASLADRFWAKVDKNGPVHPVLGTKCWIWTGAFGGRRKYGIIWLNGRNIQATHAAFILAEDTLPPDKLACHHCDTPACVRRDHLFAGTFIENMEDAKGKGRTVSMGAGPLHHRFPSHGANPSAKLTAKDIEEIRTSGLGSRPLARRFNVARTTMQRILSGKTWKVSNG